VIRNLFDKNSQLLVSNQDVFKITRNTADFRTPQEVTNGWYLETNIDSNTKFSTLKRILTLFGSEEELTIKYLPDSGNQNIPSRYGVRRKFWQQLLPQLKDTDLFNNVNPTKDSWISAGAGIGGLAYTLTATKSCVRIELGIMTSSKEKNKAYFKKLLKKREAIEVTFGKPLEWEDLPDNKMSRIKIEERGVSLFNESDWEKMSAFIVSHISDFENAFQGYIKGLKK